MATKAARRVLGRGLTNLIPQDTPEQGSGNEVAMVDIQSIRPNPFQPRTEFSDTEIGELAESIKTQGLLQPVLLRKVAAGGYEIISGERRVRALRSLGRTEVPALVKPTVTDTEMLEMALVENVQREQLSEIETARAYQRLLNDCGLSHEDLSTRVGKSRSAVTNALRMLKLPLEVQDLVLKGTISAGHARALLAVDSADKQCAMAQEIVALGLSVRQTEALSQESKGKRAVKEPHHEIPERVDPNIESLQERLRYRFGTDVALRVDAEGKGRIEIRFFSTGDLNRILPLLGA